MACFHFARDRLYLTVRWERLRTVVTNGLVTSYWAMAASVKEDIAQTTV